MATRKDFQQIASGLMNGSFKDFLKPVSFKQIGYYDYDQQAPVTGDSVSTKGIRLTYGAIEFQNQAIQQGDVKIIVENTFDMDIRVDGTEFIFDGDEMDIVAVELDPADAVYTIQARPK